jgi:dipeptidase
MYCGITKVPETFAVGNGDMMTFSDNAAFWVFNQLTNFAYTRTSLMIGEIQSKQKELEEKYFAETAEVDKESAALHAADPVAAVQYLTDYSTASGNKTVAEWKDLYKFLFTKYMDGNVKVRQPLPEGNKMVNPKVSQPGYGEEWNRWVSKSTGDRYKEPAKK